MKKFLLPFNPPFPLDLAKKHKKTPLKNLKSIVDRQQIIAPENQIFSIGKNCFISFTKEFKYLGFWISYDLNDICDINPRIKEDNQTMGAL